MGKDIDLERTGEKHYSLDVRGQVCPYPELLTLRALQSLASGDCLEIVLDNPTSLRDVPLAIEKRGYGKPDISSVNKLTWKITIQVSK